MKKVTGILFAPLAPLFSAVMLAGSVYLFSDSITMNCEYPGTVDFVREYVVSPSVNKINEGVDWAFSELDIDKPSVLELNVEYAESASSFSKRSVCGFN